MWPDDPRLRSAALELYGAVWEHLPAGIEQARAWGSDWFAVSTPFTVRSGDAFLAHAGVVRCQLQVAGRRVEVPALHGVCVHPDHRGRGLGRRVIEDALAHVREIGARSAILWSEKVDLYRRFGFEAVPESVFLAEAPAPVATRATRLNLARPADRDLLLRALRTRSPVSDVIAAADDGWHFLIDLALWTEARDCLVSLPEFDTVMLCELEGSLLRLYDVLGPEMPPAAVLAGAVQGLTGAAIEHLEIYFSPDRLSVATKPAPHPIEDILMVYGEPLPVPPGTAFALSPMTRT